VGTVETARLELARVALAAGDLEETREVTAEVRDAFEELGASHREGRSLTVQGEIAATRGTSSAGALGGSPRHRRGGRRAPGRPDDAPSPRCREAGDDEEDVENINTLNRLATPRVPPLAAHDGDLNTVIEKTQMDTARVFVRWLESVDGVERDLRCFVASNGRDAG